MTMVGPLFNLPTESVHHIVSGFNCLEKDGEMAKLRDY